MILAFWGNGCPQSVRHSFLFFCGATGHRIWVGPSVSFAKPGSVGSIPGIWLVVSPNSLGATAEKSSVFTMLTHVTSEGLKTYSGSNKIKHWYQKKTYRHIFQWWVGNIFLDPEYVFFDQATRGSKCSSSPLEGIKTNYFRQNRLWCLV